MIKLLLGTQPSFMTTPSSYSVLIDALGLLKNSGMIDDFRIGPRARVIDVDVQVPSVVGHITLQIEI